MIEAWIDDLADVWAGIDLGNFGRVNSPHLIKDAKFPASIAPTDDFPIAINLPTNFNPGNYGVSAPKRAFYSGVTQFHLKPNGAFEHMPELLPWFGRILKAAAGNPTLNGKVELFWIPDQVDAITLGRDMTFGEETPHWGMLVKWNVKEPYDSQITVAMR